MHRRKFWFISVCLFLSRFLLPDPALSRAAFEGSCTNGVNTAIGCLPFGLNPFVSVILRWGVGLAGGILIIIISIGALYITTAGGDAKKVKAGQELITSAIGGIIIIIFSVILLNFLGVEILDLGGLGFRI